MFRGIRKGQSAIEYLMSYGWMLLVVAVVGAAVFSYVQGQNVESISGFSGDSIRVSDVATTSDGKLAIEVQNMDSDRVQINSINISDGEGSVNVENKTEIPVGEKEIFEIDNVTQGDSTNSYDITIDHNSGKIENLQATGSISGNYELNTSIENFEDNDTQDTTSNLEVETLGAEDITTSTALLKGNITNSSSEPDTKFFYGDTEDNLDKQVDAGTSNSTFNASVEDLEPSTTYYYNASANSSDIEETGSTLTFQTEDNITTETLDVTKSGDGYKTMWGKPEANIISADLSLEFYQPTSAYGVSSYFDQGSRSNYEFFKKANTYGGDNKDINWRNESQVVYTTGSLGSSTSTMDINVTENGENMTTYFRETDDTVSNNIDNFNRIRYDGDASSHSATVAGNITYSIKPNAEASANTTNIEVGETVLLNASNSTGYSSEIETYRWDFNETLNKTGKTVEHEFNDSGQQTVNLTVEDKYKGKDRESITIDVN